MIESFDKMVKHIADFDNHNYDSDWRWQLLAELYHKNYEWFPLKNRKSIIPKKIHQIWLGSPFPEKYKVWAASWKKLNPDYEYKLWTEVDVDSLELPNREAYDAITNNGPKSDILRYHILNKFGGIYIDTDFECLKSFDDLSYLSFYSSAGYPSGVEIYPGLIACIPHHPVMEKLTLEIDKVTKELIDQIGALNATSSYLFTKVFFEAVKEYQKGMVIFPPDYFYPYPNNFIGFRNSEGTSFIKPCSFAIHYWESSWNLARKGDIDWIQGDKFVKIADFVYAPNTFASDDYAKYPNTFDPLKLGNINIVYTNTMYLARLLRIVAHLPQRFIVLSHNGDQHTDKGMIGTYANGILIAEEPYQLSDNIIKMYVQNVNVIHPRISTIPLGLENSMWGTQKKEIMSRLMKDGKKRIYSRNKLVFMNHSTNTRFEERQMLYDKFGKLSWVTTTKHSKDLESYFKNILTHKFIMNPWGNCFDNHRMWEAFYLGCIPITKRCIFTSFYEDFPICLIDSWDEVTEDFLNKEYERINKLEFNKDKLKFFYWRTKVRAIQ